MIDKGCPLFGVGDAHTHVLKHDAVVNRYPGQSMPNGYIYSVGIHPWHVSQATDEQWGLLERLAERPDVVAIGEAGLDKLCDTPWNEQVEAFYRHIVISERLAKPLIIHNVRANQEILDAHSKFRPVQPWVIHGFRGKPQLAEMFLRRGIYLSFGAEYNLATLAVVPPDRLLRESDESAE